MKEKIKKLSEEDLESAAGGSNLRETIIANEGRGDGLKRPKVCVYKAEGNHEMRFLDDKRIKIVK